MQSSRPLLVIVSGAPGSGKTTLARRLATDSGLTLLSKDAIKEALSDAVGHPEDVAASQRLGVAAYAALHALARELVAAGRDVIVESNFWRGRSEVELLPLASRSDARMIHCTASSSLVVDRYRERHARGERHAAHFDPARMDDLEAGLASTRFGPPALDVPCVEVRTDDGYAPSYDTIRAFIGERAQTP